MEGVSSLGTGAFFLIKNVACLATDILCLGAILIL